MVGVGIAGLANRAERLAAAVVRRSPVQVEDHVQPGGSRVGHRLLDDRLVDVVRIGLVAFARPQRLVQTTGSASARVVAGVIEPGRLVERQPDRVETRVAPVDDLGPERRAGIPELRPHVIVAAVLEPADVGAHDLHGVARLCINELVAADLDAERPRCARAAGDRNRDCGSGTDRAVRVRVRQVDREGPRAGEQRRGADRDCDRLRGAVASRPVQRAARGGVVGASDGTAIAGRVRNAGCGARRPAARHCHRHGAGRLRDRRARCRKLQRARAAVDRDGSATRRGQRRAAGGPGERDVDGPAAAEWHGGADRDRDRLRGAIASRPVQRAACGGVVGAGDGTAIAGRIRNAGCVARRPAARHRHRHGAGVLVRGIRGVREAQRVGRGAHSGRHRSAAARGETKGEADGEQHGGDVAPALGRGVML